MSEGDVDLIALARSDPETAISRGRELAASSSGAERLAALRAVGYAHRVRGDVDVATDVLEGALTEAELHGDAYAVSSIRLTLSGCYLLAGRSDESLELLDPDDCHPDLRPNFLFQRGTIHARSGETTEAMNDLDRAERLSREAGDTFTLATVFKNRAQLHLMEGRTSEARHDLARALETFAARDDPLGVATVGHSLGMTAAAEGDLAEALEWLDATESELQRLEGANLEPGRAQVLLAAGLFEEARDEGLRLIDLLRDGGMATEVPEALLLVANAAELAGRLEEARKLAAQARREFASQGRSSWANRAALIELTADEAQAELSDLEPLIADLDDSDPYAATRARLVAARVAARAGHRAKAQQLLDEADAAMSRPPLPLGAELRLSTLEVRQHAGDSAGAARAASAGMRLLATHQRAVAATDVRAGLAQHARRLADRGLALAVESGDARRVWRWMEYTRATALRYRQVNADEDPELRELLNELRSVTAELHAGDGDQLALTRRQRRLERQITDRARAVRGGAAGDDLPMASTMRTILDAIGDDRCLIQLAEVDDRLHAVVARGGRVRLAELGPASAHAVDARQLDSQMRRAVSLEYSEDAHERLIRRIRAITEPFRSLVPDGASRVVVVPTAGLSSVPWTVAFDSKPASVAPSASLWHSSRAARPAGRVAAISGPGLEHADIEIARVASIHPDGSSHPLPTAERALELIGSCEVAHLACHGTARADQPLFSSLRLGDGDLHLYELEHLSSLPRVMVLSACDTGATQRLGREMLGMASVLMASGVGSVVASPWPIPDVTATVETMTRLHHGLARALPTSAALAQIDAPGPSALIGSAFLAFGS